MNLKTAFETMPADDDLLYSIEYWDAAKIGGREARHTDREVGAFVHPKTATAARILEADDGTYSVQPSMGDYDDGDCVIQSDDPMSFVSGSNSVVMTEIETLSEARAIAYSWMRGWVMRNSNIGEMEGSVVDSDDDRRGESISE